MEILLLGTFHFDTTSDAMQMADEAKKQITEQQLETLTDELAAFGAEQIFVEYPMTMQQKLNQHFEQYISQGTLESNEIFQIGFRLAKKLGHSTLYAVDWNESIEGVADFTEMTDPHSLQQFAKIMECASSLIRETSNKLQQESLIAALKYLNSPEQNRFNHQIYTELMQLDDPVAFDWVANYWYYRNLKIAKNILKSLHEGAERAMILYGSGHNYLLKQMLEDVDGITVITYGEG